MDPLRPSSALDIDTLEQELSAMWGRASTDGVPVLRARTLNLIVACADGEEDLQEVTSLLAGISEAAPCRALVIAADGFGEPRKELDAYVSSHCHLGAGGSKICSEQVTLRVRHAGSELVPSTVLQLLVEDLPVVLWWRRPRLSRDPFLSQLLGFTDCLLVDSEDLDDPGRRLKVLDRLIADSGWGGRAADVNWARLEPWREALASLFDTPDRRRWLSRITTVTIASGATDPGRGPGSAALYLAGWLASRLGWRAASDADHWLRGDGGPVRFEFRQDPDLPQGEIGSASIEAVRDGASATFAARRASSGGDFVMLCVEGDDPCPPAQKIKLPSRDTAALLTGTLHHAEQDPVFASALHDAASMR